MELPDGPKTLPFMQLLQWVFQPLAYLDKNAERYGDCFTARLGALPPIVFISNPQLTEAIFTAHEDRFDTGKSNKILRPTLGDNSLLLLDGERHQRQRQLLMPPFHGERMRAYSQLIAQITEEIAQTWKEGTTFSLRPQMQEISLRVILQAVFGLHEGPRYNELKQRLTTFLEATTSPFGSAMAFFPVLQRDLGAWSPGGRFVRRKQKIDDLLYSEIRDRRAQLDPSRSDILSMLLAARDEEGQPMTEVELRDELITLLLAGHETTATALTWAVYWIGQNPTVKEKLLAELNTWSENPDLSLTARLPYLNAVCAETLRLYPVAVIVSPRVVKERFNALDYSFGAGTMLAPCIYLTHQRKDLYPEPRQFRPERFLERQFAPSEYLPFGGGSRRCIGAAFALMEMKLVLVTLLTQFQFANMDKQPVQPTRRGVTMAPAGGVQVRINKRSVKGERTEQTVLI
jgi:cytochrome P450 family 110